MIKYKLPKPVDPHIAAQEAIISELEQSRYDASYKLYKNKMEIQKLAKEQAILKRKCGELVSMIREARIKFNIPFEVPK